MKHHILFLAVLCSLYSCKNSNIIKTATAQPDSDIAVSGPSLNNISAGQVADSQYNLLGYGYDVTGKYADTGAVRVKAIDVAAYDANNPGRVVLDLSKTAGSQVITALNAEDLARQLSARLTLTAGTGQFKGTITTVFGGQDALASKYVYSRYSLVIQQKRVKMMDNIALLMNVLTASFIQDVQNLSAAGLVKKYGTHVLSDIVLGARLNIDYQAATSSADKLGASSQGFRYALRRVFGLSTGALDPIDLNAASTVSAPKIIFDAVGADLSKIKISNNLKNPQIDITAWQANSTADGAVFIDISQNGLIPLYDLISDPVKQLAVKTYIDTYLSAGQVKLIN